MEALLLGLAPMVWQLIVILTLRLMRRLHSGGVVRYMVFQCRLWMSVIVGSRLLCGLFVGYACNVG